MIPILYNDDFSEFNRLVLPLYGKNIIHTVKKFEGVQEFCLKKFEYTNSRDAIVVFPKELNYEVSDLYLNSLNKYDLVYGFSNDIVDEHYNYNENIILYRTALLKSLQKKTEYSFPAFCEDSFKNNYVNNISIGYCGHLFYGRKNIINKFNLLKYEKNFIIRNELLTGTTDIELKNEFIHNIDTNLFTLCYRGAGNYCYRFYETLMMGRIPILIDSDRCFIFEKEYDINDICLVIQKEDEIQNIENKIDNFITSKNLKEIQKNNRYIWEMYCSPIGFLKQFIKNMY